MFMILPGVLDKPAITKVNSLRNKGLLTGNMLKISSAISSVRYSLLSQNKARITVDIKDGGF